MKSHSYLPLIKSPRSYKPKNLEPKIAAPQAKPHEEEDVIFTGSRHSSGHNLASLAGPLSPDPSHSRLSFFESFRKLPFLSKRPQEEESISIAYLSECHKKGLSPMPLGLAHSVTSCVNVRNFAMGDNYAKAFSKGIKKVKNLEKLNVGANSLSPRGTGRILKQVVLQPLKELNLKDNLINLQTLKPLIGLIQKQTPSLKYLNLENTCLGDSEVVRLCEVISNDRVLNFLGLAINSLGVLAAVALKNMLIENHYLKKLDLHWNNFKDSGAALIFEGLSKNDSLKELDLSWNSIGKNKDKSNVKKIGSCFGKIQGLAHLDLSFNYFTAEECTIISEGLRFNHDLLGLHLLGNEGFIDSQGFLIGSEKCMHSEQSLLFKRIFEESRNGKPRPKRADCKCWICEGWVEMTFVWTLPPGAGNNGQMFIHLECDDYEPDLMIFANDRYEISRVVPPGDIRFFFSKHNYPIRSKEYDLLELQSALEKEAHYTEEYTIPIMMHVINVAKVTGALCDYKNPFTTQPRKAKFYYEPPTAKPERIKWDISVSLFKDYRFLDSTLADECFEFDWKESRLPTWVKTNEQEQLKSIIRSKYMKVIETFKYLGSQSGNEYFTIGSNAFTDFLNQGSLIDALYESSDLGVNWNSVIVPKEKKQPYNPGNALVRYEFMEILVRVAYDRYVRNKICSNISDAFSMLLNDKLLNLLSLHNSQFWRDKEYLIEETDVVLKAHKPILDAIFKIYSGRKSLPGQKPFMCLEEFRQMCVDGKLIPEKLPAREIDACFAVAMMIQVDELFEKKHIEMNFVEFLEGLCRVCWYMEVKEGYKEDFNLSDSLGKYEEAMLTEKIEKAMWNLYHLCPKNVQDNFAFPTKQTYNAFMYKFDKKPTSFRDIYKDQDD